MDILNPFSLLSVNATCDDSDDEEIIPAVEGAFSFVDAYQWLQHECNDKFMSDMDENGHPQRKKHRGSLFHSSRWQFGHLCKHNVISLDYLRQNTVYGVKFQLIFCM